MSCNLTDIFTLDFNPSRIQYIKVAFLISFVYYSTSWNCVI
jgi:hypothetical protein